MNRKRHTLAVMMLLAAGLSVAGCKTGESGAKRHLTTVKAQLASNTEAVTNAAAKTVEAMNLEDVHHEWTDLDGKVTARTAQDSKVTIDIEKAGDDIVDISIQVGMFGDEEVSLQILRGIKDHLGG